LAGGHYGLAGLVAFLFVLGIAKRAEERRILGGIEAVNPINRVIHRAVFAQIVQEGRMGAAVEAPMPDIAEAARQATPAPQETDEKGCCCGH
jgi:hypothetical protein